MDKNAIFNEFKKSQEAKENKEIKQESEIKDKPKEIIEVSEDVLKNRRRKSKNKKELKINLKIK